MKRRNLLFALLVVSQLIAAQTAYKSIMLGVDFLKNEYNGDYGSGILNFNQWNSGLGLSLSKSLGSSFDLGLQGSIGMYGYVDKSKPGTNPLNPYPHQFAGTKYDASLFGYYKFNNGYLLSKKSKISPFLSLGLGLAGYGYSNSAKPDPTIITGNGVDFIVPFGIGVKYHITKTIAVQYQYLYNFAFGENADIHDTNEGKGVFFSSTNAANAGYTENGRNDAFGSIYLVLL